MSEKGMTQMSGETNGRTGNNGKPKTESEKRKVLKTLQSVKKPKSEQDGRKPIVQVGPDNIFGSSLVYIYGPLELYKEIREKLYGAYDSNISEAKGYCSFGCQKRGDDHVIVGIVWVNWKTTKEQAMPTFVHELSHAVDDILEHAGVTDKNGEAKAYFIESEFSFLLEKIYGIKMPRPKSDLVRKSLNGILQER